MSTSSSPTPPPSLRDYFEQTQLHKLLERLVVDLGEARPVDVLKYIEEWAHRERTQNNGGDGSGSSGGAGSGSEQPGDGTPIEVVRKAWKSVADPTQLCKNFFTVLFTQHASLKRKLFADVDFNVIEPALGKLLTQYISGSLTASEVRALAKTHSANRQLETKHTHYFLTAMLTALGMTPGASERFASSAAADAFRVVLTQLGDDLLIGAGLKESEDVPAAATTTLKGSWDAVTKKITVVDTFFKTLFLQHPSARKRFIAGAGPEELAALSQLVLQNFEGVLDGTVGDEALRAIGVDISNKYPVEQKHFDYVLSAALFALSQHVPQYREMAGTWLGKLTHILSTIRAGAFTSRAAEESFLVPSAEVNSAKRSTSIVNPKEAIAAFASLPPFDVVRECWSLIMDKPAVVMRVFTVLLTQHSSLLKTVLKDLDLEALAPTVVAWVDGLVMGTKPISALSGLAREYGVPRRLEVKHLHYFLSAALVALNYSIGDTFLAVADQWRLVLTSFIDEITVGLTTPAAAAPSLADGNAVNGSISVSPHAQPAAASNGDAAAGSKKSGEAAVGADKDVVLTDEQCLSMARASWKSLTDAKRSADVIQNFFTILFTQHPTAKRSLFADVDVAAVAEPFEAAFTAAVNAATFPDLPLVVELAKVHGAPRGVETRHFHYFLSAFLASLSIVIGRADFPKVAEPWRVVCTNVMHAAMTGCGLSPA